MRSTLIIIFLIPLFVFAQETQNYEDCILENMKGVSSDVAAEAIKEACESKFAAQDIPEIHTQAIEASLNETEVFQKPSFKEYVLNEESENKENGTEDSPQQQSFENPEDVLSQEIKSEALPKSNSEPAFPYISDYEFKVIKGGNFINRKMTYADDRSFSILVTHLNGYQSNPFSEKPYGISKSEESFPIYDKAFTRQLSESLAETLQAWAFIQDTEYSDIQIESLLSPEVIEDLSSASEKYKTSNKKRWKTKFKPKTLEEIKFLPTNYLLVLNVDSVSHFDWMKTNMSKEDIDNYYEDIDKFFDAVKVAQVGINMSGLASVVLAPTANIAFKDLFKTVYELARVNVVSAYLISKNGTVMWGHKDTYVDYRGDFNLAEILRNANFLRETRNIKVAEGLSISKDYPRVLQQ